MLYAGEICVVDTYIDCIYDIPMEFSEFLQSEKLRLIFGQIWREFLLQNYSIQSQVVLFRSSSLLGC